LEGGANKEVGKLCKWVEGEWQMRREEEATINTAINNKATSMEC
jgi:hypothetical protein